MVLTEFNDLTKLVQFFWKMLQVYNVEKAEYNNIKEDLEARLKTEGILIISVGENNSIFDRMMIPIIPIFAMKQEWDALKFHTW